MSGSCGIIMNTDWNNYAEANRAMNIIAGYLVLFCVMGLIFLFLYSLACSFRDEILKDDAEDVNINVNLKIVLKNDEKENNK